MEKFTDTIRSLNEKLVAGQVTSVELVEEAIRRIKAENDVINAVITLDEENALAKAKASDDKGLPIGLQIIGNRFEEEKRLPCSIRC